MHNCNAAQTEVEELSEALKQALVAKGLRDAEADEIIDGEFSEAEAGTLWNYIYIVNEDICLGVHNPATTRGFIAASLETLQ